MFSFRQKIFLSYVLVFLIFLATLSPFASLLVRKIVVRAMENRSYELISKIQTAPNNEALLRRLKELKPLIFFRVSIITDDRRVLYDSHTKRLLGPRFSQEHVVDHPEVLEAFEYGTGYNEDYSDLLSQKFAYLAVAFDFHGHNYVMRTAFPHRYINELINDSELGFLLLATAVLVLFSILTWFIIGHLTKPVQAIISAVGSYEEGKAFPQVKINNYNTGEDIVKLANTLNSLSNRIQKQITTLRSERNEKQVLLESLVEGVVAVDQNMAITFANTSGMKFLELSGNVSGSQFLQNDKNRLYQLLLDCQAKDMPCTETIQIDDSYLDVVAAPKKDNSGAILVLEDKTSHYLLLEMRKDFVANASHELKTPITIIRGFAETLHDNPELPKEVTVDITGKIVKNCERMTTVVKDLLALADIENIPVFRMKSFDIVGLTEKAKNFILEVFPEAKITVQSTLPEIMITADPELIELALQNLISNAVKYSSPPADVTVNLKQTDEKVEIRIQDKGIGIPKQDLNRIFERFYRVDKAHSRKVGGSGLGLSIVQTIVKKHFGTIKVESELGVGTTFTVELPIKYLST